MFDHRVFGAVAESYSNGRTTQATGRRFADCQPTTSFRPDARDLHLVVEVFEHGLDGLWPLEEYVQSTHLVAERDFVQVAVVLALEPVPLDVAPVSSFRLSMPVSSHPRIKWFVR